LTEPAPVLVTSRKIAPWYFYESPVAYAVLISNTGNLTATVWLTDTPPAEMQVLAETLSVTSGLTPTYDGVSIHWSGTVAPDGETRITYALSPTVEVPLGTSLTNTVEIVGSVSGPFTRRAVVTRKHLVWLPVIYR